MSEHLTSKFMDQLELLIGTGPKTFKLLYSISQDGCNNKTFHQKCDNKGPTVTILYNQQGSVYGGYTAINWDQSATNGDDPTAFLFRLQYDGAPAVYKFPCKTQYTNHAVYRHPDYGPVFGHGNDLRTFTGTVNNTGGTFPLNGHMKLNITYDAQGVTADQINNGTMEVTDLEVYSVSDGHRDLASVSDKPWREIPELNTEFLDTLKLEVEHFSPPRNAQVRESKILMIGPVGAGKSSFFNTIASVFRGRVTSQASSGSAEHSITSQYRMYQVRARSCTKPLKFRFCDTRGLEESQGIDAHDLTFLLDGNVPDGYHFNPSLPISSEIQGFKKNTTLKDKIHCVCIVVDGSTAAVLSEKMQDKIKSMQLKVHVRGIPQMFLLTKIDKMCPIVAANTAEVFKSTAIMEQVERISQIFGVPPNHVLPVRNYIREIEVNDKINILALVTLRQILRVTDDYMFNFLDEVRRDSDSSAVRTAVLKQKISASRTEILSCVK